MKRNHESHNKLTTEGGIGNQLLGLSGFLLTRCDNYDRAMKLPKVGGFGGEFVMTLMIPFH
jgi:hypothetical protein